MHPLEPEVVREVRLGGHPHGPGRDPDQLGVGLLWCRTGLRVEPGRGVPLRHHPLERRVPPLELGGATRRGDPTGPEEVLERELGQRPVPPPVLLAPLPLVPEVGLDLPRRARPPGGHLVEDRGDEVRVLATHPLDPAPGPVSRPPHPRVLHERPRARRHEAGLVRPVLDEPPRGAVAHPVEQGRVERTQAGEEGQVVAAGQDVDAVHLDEPDGVDDPLEVTGGHRAVGPGPRQALGGERDPAGAGQGQGRGGHPTTLPVATDNREGSDPGCRGRSLRPVVARRPRSRGARPRRCR